MSDNEKIEKLEKDLQSITKKYELLLAEFEKIFKYYEEGYEIARRTIISAKMKDLFLPDYINSLFAKMEESSKKIRDDAENGKYEFNIIRNMIRNDDSISNYRDVIEGTLSLNEERKEKIRHINDNLIYCDVQNKYDDIIKMVNDLKIPEESIIIKKNLDVGSWKVINTEDSSVIYEGQVIYNI